MRRRDVGIKILLNLFTIGGVVSMAGGLPWAWVSVIASASAALLATAILPALGWDDVVPRIHGFRGRWINLSLMAKSFWDDFHLNGKEPSKRAIEALEAGMSELDKESTWLNDNQEFKDEAEKELAAILLA